MGANVAGMINKGVSFKIVADAGTAKEQLEEINEQADKLREPIDLKVGGEGTSGITAELDALKESVTGLDESVVSLGDATNYTTDAQGRLRDSQGRFVSATEAAKGVTDSFRDSLSGLGDTAAAVREIEAALAEADDVLLKGQRSLASSAAAEARALKTLAAAEEDVSAAAKKAGESQEAQSTKTDESAGLLGKSMGTLKLAALGAGAGIVYGTVQAAKFNQEMLRVHTLAGVSTTQLNQMKPQVLALAGVVGASPDSLAESLYHVASNMASMHATAPQMIGAVKIAAEGAAVGGANLVDVTNALGAAIASGIPGVQNYQSAMGMLNATVGAGDMSMQDLAEAMGTGFLSNVKLYGTTLSDVGAILATFGDNNIRGAHAGTQLRMSVQSLAVQAATATPYLKEMGLQANSIGQYQAVHGTVATIDMLAQKFKQLGITSDATQKQISSDIQKYGINSSQVAKDFGDAGNVVTQLFGKKAGAGIAVLIDQYERLNSKQKVLTEGAGTFGKEWQEQSQQVSQEWANLKDGLDALAIKLGSTFLPITSVVLKGLTGLVDLLTKSKGPAIALATVIGGLLAGFALKKLEEGVKTAKEGFEGLWKAGESGVGLVKKMISYFSGLGSTAKESTVETEDLWLKIKRGQDEAAASAEAAAAKQDVLTVATDGEKVATEGATEAQEGLFVTMMSNPITLVIVAIAALVVAFLELWKHSAAFRDFWKGLWKDIKQYFDDAFGFIKHNWPLILGILTGPVGIAVLVIKRYGGDIVSFFSELPGKILGVLSHLAGDMFNFGSNIIWGVIHGIESAVGGLLNYVSNIAGSIGHAFSSVLGILSPSKVFHGFGRNIVEGLANGISENANLATASVAGLGRSVAGSLSVHGPGAAGGTGGGTTVNITVQGLVGDAGATGRQIATALNEYLRQTGQRQLVGA